MGLWSRLRAIGRVLRSSDSTIDEMLWGGSFGTSQSVSGVQVNQQTALNATAILACVGMLAEDFAKLTPGIYRRDPRTGARVAANDHDLYSLLWQPNDWQNWFEFAEMMQFSLVMRGNAYAVIVRSARGAPVRLIPVNADWVALWESPNGALFYRVTPNGLHMMAELAGQPFLIPAEDVLHVRGFSMNGLVGASRIALAKEAIGLALAQEQQAAHWMGNKASLSGVLTTDSKLTPEAAQRMATDWKAAKSGVQNAGKIAVLEQGLKYQAISMTASDVEFIASRQFQLQEVVRIFRVPLHMVGDLSRSTNNNISQQAQEYINFTISGYTQRWKWKMETAFGLREQGLFVDFDLGQLIRADIVSRYNAYRTGIMSTFLTPDEARIDDGRDPMGGRAAELQYPVNMTDGTTPPAGDPNAPDVGSQSTGDKGPGGGRPPADGSKKKTGAREFNPDQPRDEAGRFTTGGGSLADRFKSWFESAEISKKVDALAATIAAKAKDPEVVKSVLGTAVNQAIGHYVYTHDYMDSDVVAHAIQYVEVGLSVTKAQAIDTLKGLTGKLISWRRDHLTKTQETDEILAALLAFGRALDAAAESEARDFNPAQPRDPATGKWISVFGDKPDDELALHDKYFADSPEWMKELIAATPALKAINYVPDPVAYFSKDSIFLEENATPYRESAVWRHEYGHAIDKFHTDRARGAAFPSPVMREGTPSSLLRDAIAEDRDLLSQVRPGSSTEIKEQARVHAFNLMVLKSSEREGAVRKLMANDPLDFDDLNSMAFVDLNNRHHIKALATLHAQISSGDIDRYLKKLERDVSFRADHYHMMTMTTDYINAASGEKLGVGHGKEYYQQFRWLGNGVNEAHAMEVFANHVSIVGSAPEVAVLHQKLVQAIVPNTWAKMESVLAGLNK